MNKLIKYLTITLTLAAASPAWAVDEYLKANVSGTIQTQIIIGVGEGRIRTVPLNNKRIFQEFGVLPEDYELVVTTSGFKFQLVPKLAAANLPTITIMEPGAFGILVDTQAKVQKFQAEIAPVAATNIFKDAAGELGGAFSYKGAIADGKVTKIVISVTAIGTDPVGGNTTYAFLKFKIVAKAAFVQQ